MIQAEGAGAPLRMVENGAGDLSPPVGLVTGLVLLAFALPLVIFPASTDVFLVPKFFFEQAAVLLLTALVLVQGTIRGSIPVPRIPLALPALALLAASLLSLRSTLNLYEGVNSVFRLLIHLLLFLLVVRAVTSRPSFDRLVRAMILAAIPISLYGLSQARGWDFLSLEARFVPVSTLGNLGYVSQVLVPLVSLAIGQAITASSRPLRVLSGVALLLALAHLLLVQRRAGFVALMTAALILLLLLRGRRDLPQIPIGRLAAWIGGSLLAIALCLGLLVPGVWQGVTHRVVSIPDLTDVANRVRILIWQSTLTMVRDHPLTGVGAGNYALVYPRYRKLEEWGLSQRQIVGEAHNDYLQVAAEAGLIGLAAFLFLLWRAAATARAALAKSTDASDRVRASAIIAALGGLLVEAFFGFPLKNPASGAAFWVLLGLLDRSPDGTGVRPGVAWRIRPTAAWAVAVPGFAAAYVLVLGQFLSDLQIRRMREFLAVGRTAEAKIAYRQAVHLYYPILYRHEAQAKAFDDSRMIPEEITRYRSLLAASPNDAAAHADLGAALGESRQYAEARGELLKALALDPDLVEARENLGNVLFFSGEFGAAGEAFQQAIRPDKPNPDLRFKLALALFQAGRLREAEERWNAAVRSAPGHIFSRIGWPRVATRDRT